MKPAMKQRFFVKRGSLSRATALLICSLSLCACEGDDPKTTPVAGTEVGGTEVGGTEVGGTEVGGTEVGGTEVGGAEVGGAEVGGTDMMACEPAETDYPGEAWPACVSDSGRYELAGASTPSSAARTAGFELIADLLWRNSAPSSEDFIQAELIYAEAEGLQSRVARRYDKHVPKPEGADCSLAEAGETWPEYCVGPALIDPLIGDAFAAGVAGEAPAENAQRIRAGLLWFFYVSAYKEANTCAGKKADCDSHWAYTNGGVQRDEEPIALGAWVRAASEWAYEALFNAHLAVRCWRDLDSAEVAEDMELMAQALEQLDRALDVAYAQGLLAELEAYEAATGEQASALKAGLEVLGPVLWRATELRSPNATLDEATWVAQWSSLTPSDLAALRASLTETFMCP